MAGLPFVTLVSVAKLKAAVRNAPLTPMFSHMLTMSMMSLSACLQTLGFKRWYSLVSPLVFTATYSGHSGKGFQTPLPHAFQGS